MFSIDCKFQNYAWGKRGSDSEVFNLLCNVTKDKLLLSDCYAELWMGTHNSAPSFIPYTNQLLSEYLSQNRKHIGESVLNFFQLEFDHDNLQLPFLFKVLSVGKALSIQAHPNKKHAEELHAKFPHLYPDSNHKPEMAVALTSFDALCGFRLLEDVKNYIYKIPELMVLVTTGSEENRQYQLNLLDQALLTGSLELQKHIYKELFSNLMRSPETLVTQQLDMLIQRLRSCSSTDMTDEDLFLLELSEQFQGDVGCFCVYFLNIVCLQPGEAIFLEANLPHAYLKGDCVEIMACSDNVVRAGLTPKFKDIETLLEMLDYRGYSREDVLFHSESLPFMVGVSRYAPPIPDFALERILIPAFSDSSSITLPVHDSASLLLCINGQATIHLIDASLDEKLEEILYRGVVIFLIAGRYAKITFKSSKENVLLFRAYCNTNCIRGVL